MTFIAYKSIAIIKFASDADVNAVDIENPLTFSIMNIKKNTISSMNRPG